ncbi:MAG: MFS transporter, partial [Candidatus Hydrogenedentes bacterium]|nr:MFS transporter [Candidatus Hydrogenedentota bacterium]
MFRNCKATMALTMNTLAFTVCFACWMLNGVLVTFLVENQIFAWSDAQIGWVIGAPVLSGALFRLPAGILTDKYGGKYVFSVVMLLAAIPMYLLSFADSYWSFFFCSLAFGVVGASFAVGIAYTAVWFKPENQGTALGVFGAGNAGAALTSMGAPFLLTYLTNGGENVEAWRTMPRLYAGILLVMTVVFWLGTTHKKADDSHINSLRERLAPLRYPRVWRFGLYYFLLFGGFVALAQWLIPYYVNAYMMSLAMAGLMAAIFSLPSGVIRALGGYMSDRMGARRVMYGVLGTCLVASALLIVPRMAVESPGKGIMAKRSGTVTQVHVDAIVVNDVRYALRPTDEKTLRDARESEAFLILPSRTMGQKPVVKVGDAVEKKQLLAQGVTKIYFQANVWIF